MNQIKMNLKTTSQFAVYVSSIVSLPSQIIVLCTALLFIGCSTPEKTAVEEGKYTSTFFAISDPHVNVSTRKNTYRLSVDSSRILTRVVELVDMENPDFLVFPGDVVEGKGWAEKNLSEAFKILDSVKFPWFVVPGNHDRRYKKKTLDEFKSTDFLERFAGHGPDGKKGYWEWKLPGKNITLIGLSSKLEGTSKGALDETQISWLKTTLGKTAANHHVILVMHHPAVVFRDVILKVPKLNKYVIRNYPRIQKLFSTYRNKIKLVLSGHIHAPAYKKVGGINYLSIPSINSWPAMYGKIHINSSEISYEFIKIPFPKLIEDSKKALLGEGSKWIKRLGSPEAVVDYFSDSEMNGIIEL